MRNLTLFLLATLLIGACTTQKKELKPNVIIILSDDQGWGDYSFHGNKNINTPNLDNIALEGASFNNFYVSPICSPTRAELLTGRYAFRGGVYSASKGGERLDLDETTMAEVFKKAGYATAAYGKWHNGMQYPYHPNGRGFDDYYGFCSGHWNNYFSPMLEHNGKIVKGDGFVIDDFTNRGLEFMENNKDKPFLLYLPYNTPHTPFNIPKKWWDKYKDLEISMLSDRPHEENIDETRAALALCDNIDWNVGRIEKKVKDLGIEDNTIIIYFNDNGPDRWRWNGGMKGKKGHMDEGGVRSALFIKWKDRIRKGTVIEQISSVIDLLPTLTDLCDIECETNKSLDGVSLKPLLFEEDVEWNDRILLTTFYGRMSLRNQKFRLGNKMNLFDIENDRGQKVNVSEKFPEVKKQLLLKEKDFRRQIKEEMPEEDTRPFIVGHPDAIYTQLPARDATTAGQIKRSHVKYFNCTYFYDWKSVKDSILWNVEVPADGKFKVSAYYNCSPEELGSTFRLTCGQSTLDARVLEPFVSDFVNVEKNRVPGKSRFDKEWKPMELGIIDLKKGKIEMSLSALDIANKSVMELRLLMFERIGN